MKQKHKLEKILGIDPGLETVGYGVIETDRKKHSLIAGGVIKTKAADLLPCRLEVIAEEMSQLIKDYQPDFVCIERLFFARNITSALRVSQAQGVITLICQQYKLNIFEYTPLQVKMTLTGYGRASKDEIKLKVQELLKMDKKPQPADCADALGVALTHVLQINLAAVESSK